MGNGSWIRRTATTGVLAALAAGIVAIPASAGTPEVG